MKLTQTVAAAEAPITLAEARSWLSMQSGVTNDDAPLTTMALGSAALMAWKFWIKS